MSNLLGLANRNSRPSISNPCHYSNGPAQKQTSATFTFGQLAYRAYQNQYEMPFRLFDQLMIAKLQPASSASSPRF